MTEHSKQKDNSEKIILDHNSPVPEQTAQNSSGAFIMEMGDVILDYADIEPAGEGLEDGASVPRDETEAPEAQPNTAETDAAPSVSDESHSKEALNREVQSKEVPSEKESVEDKEPCEKNNDNKEENSHESYNDESSAFTLDEAEAEPEQKVESETESKAEPEAESKLKAEPEPLPSPKEENSNTVQVVEEETETAPKELDETKETETVENTGAQGKDSTPSPTNEEVPAEDTKPATFLFVANSDSTTQKKVTPIESAYISAATKKGNKVEETSRKPSEKSVESAKIIEQPKNTQKQTSATATAPSNPNEKEANRKKKSFNRRRKYYQNKSEAKAQLKTVEKKIKESLVSDKAPAVKEEDTKAPAVKDEKLTFYAIAKLIIRICITVPLLIFQAVAVLKQGDWLNMTSRALLPDSVYADIGAHLLSFVPVVFSLFMALCGLIGTFVLDTPRVGSRSLITRLIKIEGYTLLDIANITTVLPFGIGICMNSMQCIFSDRRVGLALGELLCEILYIAFIAVSCYIVYHQCKTTKISKDSVYSVIQTSLPVVKSLISCLLHILIFRKSVSFLLETVKDTNTLRARIEILHKYAILPIETIVSKMSERIF